MPSLPRTTPLESFLGTGSRGDCEAVGAGGRAGVVSLLEWAADGGVGGGSDGDESSVRTGRGPVRLIRERRMSAIVRSSS